MPRFLFHYLELFSVIGDGTPQNPGGDFGMHCWIEAPCKEVALEWGFVLLGNYMKARYANSADGHRHDGSPVREGEIIDAPEILAQAGSWNIPSCQVGSIPEWREPWRLSNIK
jgi:hypothetical protein